MFLRDDDDDDDNNEINRAKCAETVATQTRRPHPVKCAPIIMPPTLT